MTKKIEVLVEGGKATAAPPLGPQLGPLGVNTGKIVEEINKKTASLAGMQVPVRIVVDEKTKEFEIEVGTPPIASLIKKELKLDKGSGEAGIKRVGDLSEEQVKKIAMSKFGSDAEAFVSQVKGTCRSMGVTIGQGEITAEELKRYEEMEKAKAAAEAEKAAAPAAGKEGAAPEKAAKEGAEEAKEEKEAKPEEKEEEKS